jgi:FtsZ-binding cell division protein ZapB
MLGLGLGAAIGMATAYQHEVNNLKKLNKKILSEKYEFQQLKEDIHYFVSFYKEKYFEIYIFGEKKEERTKEEENKWFEDITDMLELAKYSEEPSFIKNKHIIDLFITSMEEDNTYTLNAPQLNL